MRIDWDAPIAMDDGVVLRADVFRPVADGTIPGDPELWALRQGARLPGGLQECLDAHDHGLSGDRRRLVEQVPELGAGRPGEMGAGRLRDRAGRFPRRRPLARLPRRVVAARGQGSLRMRRVGGHAAVEQRQGRHQRHLLLRHEPVARGAATAAAPGGAVHLGRLVRLLPRALPPRRHPVRLPGGLVAPPGHQRATWRRRARAEESGDRRACGRPANAAGGRARKEPRRRRRRGVAAPPDRRLLPRAHAANSRRSRCRCCRRRTGAARACIRAAISRAIWRPAPSRNGWRCTATPTFPISTRTTAPACSGASSATSSRARTPAGTSSRRSRSTSAGRAKNSLCAPRTNGRSRARNGPSSICIPRTGG